MFATRNQRAVIASFTMLTLCATQVLHAASPQPATNVRPSILDVALQDGGKLVGMYVNKTGKPVEGSRVLVRQEGKVIAASDTNAAGHFEVAGLRGGVYEISTVRGAGVFRLWTATTAPPAARQAIVLVADEGVVRGQFDFDENGGTGRTQWTLFDPYSPAYQVLSLGLGIGGLTTGIICLSKCNKGSP